MDALITVLCTLLTFSHPFFEYKSALWLSHIDKRSKQKKEKLEMGRECRHCTSPFVGEMGKEIKICFNEAAQQCMNFQFSENGGEVLERHKCRLLK